MYKSTKSDNFQIMLMKITEIEYSAFFSLHVFKPVNKKQINSENVVGEEHVKIIKKTHKPTSEAVPVIWLQYHTG